MNSNALAHWAETARLLGLERANEIADAALTRAHVLDGLHAEPLVFCEACGAPLLDSHYRLYFGGEPLFAPLGEEWWTNGGESHCPPRQCVVAPLLKVVPNAAPVRRRRTAGGAPANV